MSLKLSLRTQKPADIASGAFFALLGLVIVIGAFRISTGMDGMGGHLPPRTLPLTMGIILFLSGVGLTLRAYLYGGEDPAIAWPDRTGAKRVLTALVILAVYIALIKPLGFPLSTWFYVSVMSWYLGKYRIPYCLLLGFLSGAVVYGLFIRFLELSFPVGSFLELFE